MAERPLGGGEGYRPAEQEQVTYWDRVRWGPILAGVFVMLSVMTVLGLLGLAVQAAVADPMAPGEAAGWGWTIWSIIVLIVSFGAGGWIAANSAAVRSQQSGLLNGAMVWAVGVPVMFWVLTTVFGAVMGPAAMMAQGADIQMEQIYATPAEPEQQQQQQPEAEADAQEAINIATWGTLIALLLGLGAAAGGGYLGGRPHTGEHRKRGRAPEERGGPGTTPPSSNP